MQRIKTGDQVMVIAGRDKGRTGEVIKVRPDGKCLVRGLQMVHKTIRPNPDQGVEGGIVRREAALDISNVALIDPETNKPGRIGFKQDPDTGKKVRFFRASGKVLDS